MPPVIYEATRRDIAMAFWWTYLGFLAGSIDEGLPHATRR